MLVSGCGGFQNPAGLTRRGANVEVLSSCSDRGITELRVLDAFVPEDPEPGAVLTTTTTDDPDAEPVVLYSMRAPEGDLGEATLVLDDPPLGWTTTGASNAFGLSDRIIIEVGYGDAEGASTRLHLEQITVGTVWLDGENVEADAFADQIRECDPSVSIDGKAKTILVLLAIVAGLALIAAPLVFLWSLVQDVRR